MASKTGAEYLRSREESGVSYGFLLAEICIHLVGRRRAVVFYNTLQAIREIIPASRCADYLSLDRYVACCWPTRTAQRRLAVAQNRKKELVNRGFLC